MPEKGEIAAIMSLIDTGERRFGGGGTVVVHKSMQLKGCRHRRVPFYGNSGLYKTQNLTPDSHTFTKLTDLLIWQSERQGAVELVAGRMACKGRISIQSYPCQ